MVKKMKDTIILGIETSCDDTGAAIVKNGEEILSNLVLSQIKIHQPYGGVVPEIASRKHIENMAQIVDRAFREAGMAYSDIDAVAVSYCPGLVGALLVGVSFAKAFAYGLQKPLLGVNHMHAHIYANILEHKGIPFPAICLVVSGGHTSLLYMKDSNTYQLLGETRDDAAGEAFDKVARFMGLGYPGGPAIQKAAEQGQPGKIRLPRAYLDRSGFEFSFSGLKTAAVNQWRKLQAAEDKYASAQDLAAEFQEALVEVLVEKTIMAAQTCQANTILLAGGVAANSALRQKMKAAGDQHGLALYYPALSLCTDNAAMVAGIAYPQLLRQEFASLSLNAQAGMETWESSCGTCG